MADEDTTQTPAPVAEPAATPPEAATAPTEPEATQTPPETQTAQVPVNEPLPPEVEPIAPTPAPEPPQAASAPVAATPTHPARDLLVKARATIQDRKRKKLEKILELLGKKEKITNDEVEKLLHVSDATATRYLSALEKEGKIQQVGKTGKAVEYTRI
ncbi:MAG: Engrailed-1 [Candidatus Adlerbacteria bacterium GW2011_GWC1_50_9]|uniref:Engrailed-1 n=3 Tax=Parcubacteria group TaxID=1794811 RepID=A0A0G1WQD6_9BACT|nr:MAG: Engrailed-1 [Candidatus Adlerbacteria bacterium GW2011_GWC1_50_9]KKW23928.1 MAG: Engrailed-1 [Candidatus Kaiserbacteria bacterium GW2011_GWA2_52_12]KKW31856.1 MAG: Engrailed-1 [Candidatus Kaiserbacteria bacterium GW2011_GWC2_52_8b]